MVDNKKIMVIAGPTAVGKTAFAIEAAKRLNGEIVSADSMQLYKFMDIGSAKPTPEERAQAVHHLVDEIDPREPFSVAEYQKRAKNVIESLFERGKTPIISGGTGLYVNSLLYRMDFSAPPVKEDSYRKSLENLAETEGNQAVYRRLQEADPKAADRIHPNNLKKIIRALEVAEHGEQGIPEFSQAFVKTEDYQAILVGLNRNRPELYQRIDKRVDLLVEAGLVDEVQDLLNRGLSEDHISMKGIGYKEIIGYFRGNYDLEEAIRQVKQNSRRYAKRQLTWFRRYEDMKWFTISDYDNDQQAMEDMILWLSKNK